ncbi:MAG: glucosaminidase domain-containing protein [Woeseiaceae bacterium]|nr:glucosaminidase domain-containing protein [Woeseiaceae bacterium]
MTAAITDFNQYTSMRAAAERNDPAALREVASQFEALFVQQMLKSMREASLGDPILGNSDQHDMYQELMDQQLAVDMTSGKGLGLADMLVRQLGGEQAAATLPPPDRPVPILGVTSETWSDPDSFAKDVWPHAEHAGRRLGVAPEAILAQAALETGWGRHVMPDQRGGNSFNLFGIKAGSSWNGDVAIRRTLEFEGGVPRYERASFRAYSDVASTMDDYANLLTGNPRYEGVVGRGEDTAGFADALQESGYATDPQYARKLKSVIESPTMQRVLSGLKKSAALPTSEGLSARAH